MKKKSCNPGWQKCGINLYMRVATRLDEHADKGVAAELGQRILESMDFMILAGLDAIRSREGDDIDTLAMLTDHGSQMIDIE